MILDRLRAWLTPERSHRRHGVGVRGEFVIAAYDVPTLLEEWPTYLEWPRKTRLQHLNRPDVEPEQVSRSTNVSTTDQFNALIDFLDSTQTATDIDASHVVLGDNDSTPQTSDSALGNQVFKSTVGTTEDNGQSVFTSTLVGTGEANGNTFREVGLLHDSSSTLLNHSLTGDLDKTDEKEVTVNGSLFFEVL